MRRRRLVGGLVAGVLGTASAAAQTAPAINTDRPSFTSAPRVVGPRVVQVETGVILGRDGSDDRTATSLTLPDALVRLGLTRRLELRLGMAGWIRERDGRPGSTATSSASDTQVALEYQVAAEDGLGADVAVIAGSSVPTGGTASTGTADPFVRLVWARTVGGSVSLGGTFNWANPTVPGPSRRERLRTLETSLVLGHGLGGAWSAFWEAVARHEDRDTDAATWFANAGVQRTFGADWQADAWVGRGLNEVAPDWAGGVGLSFRFRR
ncbi:MAG: transporter [Vicinamibacterales bacterium]